MKEITMLPCEPDAATAIVHIVFGDSMAGSLKLAIKQQGYADTNKVISLHDRFSIGPLWQLDEEVGRLNRSQWFSDNINDGYDDVDNDGRLATESSIIRIDPLFIHTQVKSLMKSCRLF